MAPGANALSFLLDTLIDLYVLVIALRFVMQAVRAEYYNPLAQFVVRASNPVLTPMRRLVPSFAGQDTAALLACLLLLLAKLFSFKALGLSIGVAGYAVNPAAVSAGVIVYLAAVDLLALFFNLFFFAILVQALISWVNPGNYNPVGSLLDSITAPLLRPVRRYIKPISGLDLAPLVVVILLHLAKILVIQSLLNAL